MDEFRDVDSSVAAVGLLVSPTNGQEIVDAAMNHLRQMVAQQPETQASRIARATLDRGFFHAREDGNLARTALAEIVGAGSSLAFHVAASNFVDGLAFHQLVRPLAMHAVFVASDHPIPCEIRVPGGPIAASSEAASELLELAAAQADWIHDNPPKPRTRAERMAAAASLARPFRRNFTNRFVLAQDPLVQVADLVLWACRPVGAKEAHQAIARLLGRRPFSELERDGILVRGLAIGGNPRIT